jgi:hypothetical protein
MNERIDMRDELEEEDRSLFDTDIQASAWKE